MYRLLRKLLFTLDAESAHELSMRALSAAMAPAPARTAASNYFTVDAPELQQTLFGIDFPNPVGLAAGFDKNARYINALGALGFGFIEVGTITGQAQAGNPRPRLFRLPKDQAILNRMGFNNEGSEAVTKRLASTKVEPKLGINIGKSKVTPLEQAHLDYELSFQRLYPFADYFVVNVSSPNTPGLRGLQDKKPLRNLLESLQNLNYELGASRPKPILVKISPDLNEAQILDVVDVAHSCGLAGIVATNTTTSRDDLTSPEVKSLGAGGISGIPLVERRLEVIRLIRRHTSLPIIGVGGIFTAADAMRTLEAGANLIQVWTGFVYKGPRLARSINQGLLAMCRARGVRSIREISQSERASA